MSYFDSTEIDNCDEGVSPISVKSTSPKSSTLATDKGNICFADRVNFIRLIDEDKKVDHMKPLKLYKIQSTREKYRNSLNKPLLDKIGQQEAAGKKSHFFKPKKYANRKSIPMQIWSTDFKGTKKMSS